MNDINYLTPGQIGNVTGWPYPKSLTFCKKYGQRNGGRWRLPSQVITTLIDDHFLLICQMERSLSEVIRQSKEPYRPLAERDEEILRLRLIDGQTLKEIGLQYNLSRERVRQIVGNTGFLAAEMRREKIKLADPMESNPELAERLGLCLGTIYQHREGWHVLKGSSRAARGNRWEKWAAEQIEKQGHEVELQAYGSHFDILVDSKIKIDVKAAKGNIPPSLVGRSKNLRYSFRINKVRKRKSVDAYFCIATNSKDVFIIPYNEVPMTKDGLIFTWPTARPEIGKYQKYHNRWDLLE